MGFDLKMDVIKRTVIEQAQQDFPDVSFDDLYGNYLYKWIDSDLHDMSDVPEKYKGYCLVDTNYPVFEGYFEKGPGDCEYILVDKENFKSMFVWLDNRIKNMTLFDVFENKIEEYGIYSILDTYKRMKESNIDFDTEIAVYSHGW